MSNIRKIIPSIYLFNEKAVKGINDRTVVYDDPLLYVDELNKSGIGSIFVYDLSEGQTDEAHEKALDMIKLICKKADGNIIGAGNIKRMEDVKKLLYAGCAKVALNYSKDSEVAVTAEVSEKFGKEKILVLFDSESELKTDKNLIEKYSVELVYFPKSERDLAGTDIDFTITYVIDEYLEKADCYKKSIVDNGLELFTLKPAFSWNDLKKNSDGMVPVIVQDYKTDQVLMLAYMDEEAYNRTLETGKMTYYSRSRKSLWIKGETSSHYQFVKALYADCDMDTILASVKQIGAACHTGSYSCFFNEIAKTDFEKKNPQKVLEDVFEVIKDRKVNPRQGSYTNYLFDKGIDKILKKVGEEATEIVIAAKNPNDNEIVYEMSDFLYHMMVLMAEKNVSWEDITDELSRR
ncbi:bifunctional phosphoribosyl-AMP cyclohydrolase/phosphoribosyl-ATP diphosphatase HisIE [Butyrivibrio sp.]|uniref:bifunctional phosphoribosyl-AMP cyclohydrolase/phosphoribosyl-ATP diphosphatase HisIE n=1 Tax=Butyrivibrio sp. TaxID=28121 RepID=UPI0025BC2FFC|nr:bifunctional phosphoribosyl-AMP cyclohydrolase/phosphoribosyl-ATP diphosphatase HisIE [Butyrivibrio sp.]